MFYLQIIMRLKIIILLLLFIPIGGYAQISGTWHGAIWLTKYYQLPIVLHISPSNNSYTATLDSPEQNANGITIDTLSYDSATNVLSFESKYITARYQGTMANDTIRGLFAQNGKFLPLVLTRGEYIRKLPDLPYNTKEITFSSGDITLSGTLTTPRTIEKPIAIVLVAGSGPNNRDSKIGPHQPLYDIADYLTKEGFTVLRYDKRGIGASNGTYKAAMINDFKTDAKAAIEYLRDTLQYQKVGIIGHSEGGLIAEMIAAEEPFTTDFIILLAAPGVNGIETVVYQNKVMMSYLIKEERAEAFGRITSAVFQEIAFNTTTRQEDSIQFVKYIDAVIPLVKDEQQQSIGEMMRGEQYFQATLNSITSPYYKNFLRTNPAQYLPYIVCPILSINGSKDTQVKADTNLNAIQTLATKSRSVTIHEVEGLNHLFVQANTGLPQEYWLLKPGFSEKVLSIINDWLSKL